MFCVRCDVSNVRFRRPAAAPRVDDLRGFVSDLIVACSRSQSTIDLLDLSIMVPVPRVEPFAYLGFGSFLADSGVKARSSSTQINEDEQSRYCSVP